MSGVERKVGVAKGWSSSTTRRDDLAYRCTALPYPAANQRPETVMEALGAHLSFDGGEGAAFDILELLGMDPSWPVARLLEDVAIAARVRACAHGGDPGDPVVVDDKAIIFTAHRLLGWLLNGDTP